MKWEQRYFDRESKEDPRKSQPGELARKQAVLTKTSKRGKIEGGPGKINSKESQQHRNASEKRVEEKLCRGAVAIFPSPDFDKQEGGDQTHFIEQEPENKILRCERAVECGLRNQHQRVKPAVHSLRDKRKRDDQRSK